jgi:BON domain
MRVESTSPWRPTDESAVSEGNLEAERCERWELRELNVEVIGDTIKISVVQFVPKPGGPQSSEKFDEAQGESDANADLADRIRTALGPILTNLDLPRLHVMAEQHHVLLHGEVSTAEQERLIVGLIEEIPGVHTIESHLHIGLLPGDTQPSDGHRGPSEMSHELLLAATQIGLEGSPARCAISAAVRCIFEELGVDSQESLRQLLPLDVARFTQPNIRLGNPNAQFSQTLSLSNMVAFRGGLTFAHARTFVPLVIEILRKPLQHHFELSRSLAGLHL